jgi:DNA-binding GntR family transcriptional regulator
MAVDPAGLAEQRLRRAEKLSLPDLAYESIVEAIIDGRLPPGSRLGIDELCRQLAMSNTPIREALSRVAAERLVIRETNKGFTVTPLLSETEYHQLFDVRHLLEIHAITLSDTGRPPIDQMADLVETMSALTPGRRYRDFREFNRADREFHRALVRMSGNTFLIRAWEDLHFHLHVGRLYTGAGIIDYGDALGEHAAILDALRTGDKEQIVDRVSQHIKRAESRLSKLLPY